MNVRYRVSLSENERAQLRALLAGGQGRIRAVQRAQVLLAADAGTSEAQIAATVGVGDTTVYRIKRRFVEGGVDHALRDQPRPGGARKLTGKEEALLIATACSAPPAGRARWTLTLLADAIVQRTEHTMLSRETVRRRLAENQLKPWLQDMWCIPQVTPEYVARMEDVLDLYAAPADPRVPTISFDETPVQLIGEARAPRPVAPGHPAQQDYEYVRHGTANLFVMLNVHDPVRHVKVTAHRTAVDFAACLRDLVTIHYPAAERIRVVLDNLSTHTLGALYEAFPAEEARRLARKLEFHYVPKHASWLNMVEIEIGVLKSQCLDRRIADRVVLRVEVDAWVHQRNAAGARVRWMFTVEKARAKLTRLYSDPQLCVSAAA